ncbi:DoxX family protein [Nesterenkonia sp. LB17]|uniref:DoxX family protein n=1 Tax=unclassified Nesterenkonia TaxID=2629769 RepID=UPI001F4D0140|nr:MULTISPECIES: DoxX family protein [unclassified Nesterenkonia]MCH8560836.1 DoxX family protein [Nesterenkonia sp. DZ6]MCH8563555.1 DoxX family protein [Nesterenkonia sp. YGD6]MCH8566205.1 DoxX family protein [Nesterenkonia sp. LB17]MCH8570916.1 DoxX family protein [Nesterenkonia sp. AY15]
MEIGLLLLRLVLALVLFTHATQKLAGWFGGQGLHRQGEIFASLGLHPGRGMVLAAGLSELIAASLLLFGFLTPVGALLAAGTMVVAGVTLQLNSGKFWNIAGGGEYPYVLAAAAAVLGFTGAGAYSLDAQLSGEAWTTLIHEPASWVGVLIVLAALAAAVPFALVVRRAAAR